MLDSIGSSNCSSHTMADDENLSLRMFTAYYFKKGFEVIDEVREPLNVTG